MRKKTKRSWIFFQNIFEMQYYETSHQGEMFAVLSVAKC